MPEIFCIPFITETLKIISLTKTLPITATNEWFFFMATCPHAHNHKHFKNSKFDTLKYEYIALINKTAVVK